MARYKLHTDAIINGVRHAAGSIIHAADDWIGPHRAHVATSEVNEGVPSEGRDVPLYEKLPEEEAAPSAEEVEKARETLRRAHESETAAGAAVTATDATLMGL